MGEILPPVYTSGMKHISILVVVLVLGVLAFFYVANHAIAPVVEEGQEDTEENTIPEDIQNHINEKSGLIRVTTPQPFESISSPMQVSGEARGYWFFEATFPLVVVDWDGRIIGQGYATAQDEWMTEEFVPFTGEVTFTLPGDTPYRRGALIFQKDNPSGLPEHDDALEIPVVFE